MRRVSLLIVVTLLAGAAPVTARVAAPARRAGVSDRTTVTVRDGQATVSGRRAWPLGLHLAGGATDTAWRRAAAATLVRLGAPEQVGLAALDHPGDGGFAFEALTPAGDFDGDGRNDVLVSRWTLTPDGEQLDVEARRGSDGTSLWSTSAPGLAFVRPAKVGADGRAGALLVSYAWEGAGLLLAGVDRPTTTVVGLDGQAGEPEWTATFDGTIVDHAAGYAVSGVVSSLDTLDAVGGPATDVVVGQVDVTSAPGYFAGSVTATVVDGADGAVATTASQDYDDAEIEPVVAPAGDLDADGGQDLLVLLPRYGDPDAGWVSAFSGDSGQPLWQADGVQLDPWAIVSVAGDVTGDGSHEVLLSSVFSTARLLDGASGSTRFQRQAHMAYPLGDVDGDGRGEMGLVTFGFGVTETVAVDVATMGGVGPGFLPGSGVTTAFGGSGGAWGAGGPAAGFTVKAVDADGATVRRDAARLRLPPGEHAAVVELEPAGDVDSDGRVDTIGSVVVADLERETVASVHRLMSGRTGSSLWATPIGTLPLHAAVDGDGADVATVRQRHGGRGVVTVRDGRSGDLLWSADLRHLARWELELVAADLTGDGAAEVIVRAGDGSTRVLDGRSGAARWTLRPGPR